ncbi:MAG: TolC family protein, partial [Gemmatimonadota bacterium]
GAVLWALLLLLPGIRPAAAQESPDTSATQGRRVTLAEALRRLDGGSLELRLARGEVEAARARAVTAGTRPNPTAAVDREQLGGEGSYHETVLSVGQALDLTGQRGARREAGRRDVAAAEARLAAERFRLGAEVRRAYLRASVLEVRLGTLEETGGVFRSVERAGANRLREGDISDYELRRLQTEAARYEVLLADTRLELLQAGRDLARLVGADSGVADDVLLPADTLGAPTAPAGMAVDSMLALARVRPDVRAARAEVEAAAAQVEARRRGRRPNPTLSAGLKEQAGGLRGAVIGVSVPLPLSDRNQGPIAEAEAARALAETRLALALRNAESETRGAWERRRSLAERLALRSGFQTRAAALLRSARVSYEEGEMTLVELLDAADAYRTAREAATTLLADYLLSVADLERATGGLDR